jgi:hypothetical protein
MSRENIVNRLKAKLVKEGRISYDQSIRERMHPELEKQLRERKTSLGDHPIFPQGDETNFEEKIMSKRFNDVVNNYKKSFNTDNIEEGKMMVDGMARLNECIDLESSKVEVLEKLAEQLIREEYDMSEEDVEIICELLPRGEINLEANLKENAPSPYEMDFDSHDDIEKANGEVYKRRFLNAMIQGAAKKSTYMYHLADKELTSINPRLIPVYNQLMAAADYVYYVVPNMHKQEVGGVVRVKFPEFIGDKPVIHAQAYVFPVLLHELVKGVMELLASHGLSRNPKIRQYTIKKADYLEAEPWDMRIGPALWERFTDVIPEEDFNLKHHIFSEISELPVPEFNKVMREIMAGTKSGKDVVSKMAKQIKEDISNDDYLMELDRKKEEEFRRNTYSSDDLDGIDLSDLGL